MAVGHAPPRGWSERTYRIFYLRSFFPLAAMVTLIYCYVQHPLYVYWIVTARTDLPHGIFNLWREPWVLGVAPIAILLVADVLVLAWLSAVIVHRIRCSWRHNRVAVITCAAAAANLLLLAGLHVMMAVDLPQRG